MVQISMLIFFSFVQSGNGPGTTYQTKFNTYSTQIHFIDLTVTKNSVARAIMLVITQLYSLCMYYFQNLNFNQAKAGEKGRAGLVDRVRVNLLNK